mmetsp:Transcript_50154/g.126425  ORF Transcript_50154/g.126425 Transcript_50154/m.126425 type:complete len:219 (+) Transcript_50154:2180-2836(+)
MKNASWRVRRRAREGERRLVGQLLQGEGSLGSWAETCAKQCSGRRVVPVPQSLRQCIVVVTMLLGALVEQQVHCSGVAEPARKPQRRPALGVFDVHLRLRADEQPHRPNIAVLCCQHERRRPARAEAVEVDGSLGDHLAEGVQVLMLCSIPQGGRRVVGLRVRQRREVHADDAVAAVAVVLRGGLGAEADNVEARRSDPRSERVTRQGERGDTTSVHA